MTHTEPAPAPVKKKGKLKWILLAIIAIIVIAAIANSGGDEKSGGTISDPTSSEGAAAPAAEKPAAEAPAFPGQQDGDTVAQAGQTITLDDVATTATPLATNTFAGTDVLCSTITIQNGSDEQIDYNLFNYKLQDPAGASRDVTISLSDTPLNSGSLAAGGTVAGDVCFDATGQAGVHALMFEPMFSFSDERAVWLNTL